MASVSTVGKILLFDSHAKWDWFARQSRLPTQIQIESGEVKSKSIPVTSGFQMYYSCDIPEAIKPDSQGMILGEKALAFDPYAMLQEWSRDNIIPPRFLQPAEGGESEKAKRLRMKGSDLLIFDPEAMVIEEGEPITDDEGKPKLFPPKKRRIYDVDNIRFSDKAAFINTPYIEPDEMYPIRRILWTPAVTDVVRVSYDYQRFNGEIISFGPTDQRVLMHRDVPIRENSETDFGQMMDSFMPPGYQPNAEEVNMAANLAVLLGMGNEPKPKEEPKDYMTSSGQFDWGEALSDLRGFRLADLKANPVGDKEPRRIKFLRTHPNGVKQEARFEVNSENEAVIDQFVRSEDWVFQNWEF